MFLILDEVNRSEENRSKCQNDGSKPLDDPPDATAELADTEEFYDVASFAKGIENIIAGNSIVKPLTLNFR